MSGLDAIQPSSSAVQTMKCAAHSKADFRPAAHALVSAQMKHLHLQIAATVLMAAAVPLAAQAAVRSTEAKAPKLPAIWEEAGPQARLNAVRAAELDADRLLIERIYGVQVDSNSTVGDLSMRDDAIAAAASASLVGAINIGEPEFFDDGRVEVVKAVKIEQVVETLRKKTKEKIRADGTTELVEFDEKSEVATQGKTLEAMGNAALPGSLGQQKVMAKRAAELDAFRRLAQRLMDISIDSSTTVRQACLESDELVASLSQLIKGAEPVSIRYLDDGSCEVEMSIKREEVVRAITNSTKGRTRTTRIEDSIEESAFVETGRGTMHPPAPAIEEVQQPEAPAQPVAASSTSAADVFFETETIIRRLLAPKPVQQ